MSGSLYQEFSPTAYFSGRIIASGDPTKSADSKHCEDRAISFGVTDDDFHGRSHAASFFRHITASMPAEIFNTGCVATEVYATGDYVDVTWVGDAPSYLIEQADDDTVRVSLLNLPHSASMQSLFKYLTKPKLEGGKGFAPMMAARKMAEQCIFRGVDSSTYIRFPATTIAAVVKVTSRPDLDARVCVLSDQQIGMYRVLGDGDDMDCKTSVPQYQRRMISSGIKNAWVVSCSDGVDVYDLLAHQGSKKLSKKHPLSRLLQKKETTPASILEYLNYQVEDAWRKHLKSSPGKYRDDITIMVQQVRKNGKACPARLTRVFDGHGGHQLAEYCYQQSLLQAVKLSSRELAIYADLQVHYLALVKTNPLVSAGLPSAALATREDYRRVLEMAHAEPKEALGIAHKIGPVSGCCFFRKHARDKKALGLELKTITQAWG